MLFLKKVLTISLVLVGFAAIGQSNKFKWPEDPELRAKAQEKYTYMSDMIRAKKYDIAKSNFIWLIKNVPDLNVAVYQKGSKIYESLEKKAKDKKVEAGLQDTALWIYDERIRLFGDEANVLNRKGLKAWIYLVNRHTEDEKLFELYTKILELNGDEIYSSSLIALLDLSCKMKEKGKITEEKVVEYYDRAMQILEPRLQGEKSSREQIYKDKVDQEFMSCVKIDCDFVESKIAPKFRDNPEDVKAAKKYYGMVNSINCEETDLYYQAGELIVTKEPSPGGTVSFARAAKKGGRWDKAIEYFNKALEEESLAEQKAEYLYELADIYYRRGMKEKAKEYALKSIAAGPSHQSSSYTLIGNLYFDNVKDCDPKTVVLFRSRYIAAYEMYKKAGNSSGMSKAKAQFPSVNEMFQENYKVGDEFNTGCWMNETVTLQSRD